MNFDIIIIGAGPSGLCMAQALSGHGLQIALIERAPMATIQQPPFDGRHIGLSQRSVQTMRDLGVWSHINPNALAPLKDAKIINGPATFTMFAEHQDGHTNELGWYIPNNLIRQAAYDAVKESIEKNNDISIFCDHEFKKILHAGQYIGIETTSDTSEKPATRQFQARLLLAADSRFSVTRTAAGISADKIDFQHSMLVCEMTHAKPINYIALQRFQHHQQLSLLPMNNDPATGLPRSSVALNLPSDLAALLMHMTEEAFNQEVSSRFEQVVGSMQLTSTRHIYPLFGVYPHRLVAHRFACVGDAAVGMHPITAYGFNFGLLSIKTLSAAILRSKNNGEDIASPLPLERYQRHHQLATKLLYQISLAMANFD